MAADALKPHEIGRLVSDWFDAAGAASLKLPNGWFGRPHDNQHQLTAVHAMCGRLVIELDEQMLLVLAHPSTVDVSRECLRVSGFTHGTWDWDEYGTARSHLEVLDGGAVEFYA